MRLRAVRVVLRVPAMLCAIDFHDEARDVAIEIDDIAIDRDLTLEFRPVEA